MSDDIAARPPGPSALRVHTTDGLSLEAEYAPATAPERASVVLAHPHPQQGGSMRSLVTSELFNALPGRGLNVLRFNFRGVEGSEGSYGGGEEEHEDVIAAIDGLVAQGGAGPIVLAGWSFGADVSLSVLDARLAGWFLIAAPLRILPASAFVAAHDDRPKCFVVPERDQFRPPDGIRELTAGWTATDVHVVPGADHFLVGRTRMAVDLLDAFVSTLTS